MPDFPPKISVIVPVYNAEKYLHECIDSILAQIFTDFELILVNDGSKDSSGTICDDYAKNDVRVRVIHQTNGGVSRARNRGIDDAKGEWIAFVDSDDWIDHMYFVNLESNSGNPHVDMVLSGYAEENSQKEISCYNPKEERLQETGLINAFEKYLGTKIFRSPWCKLISRELLMKNGIRFEAGLSFGEDLIFSIDCMLSSKSIDIIEYSGYTRRYTPGSLSKNININDLSTYINLFREKTFHIYRVLGFSEIVEREFLKRTESAIIYIYSDISSWVISRRESRMKALVADQIWQTRRIKNHHGIDTGTLQDSFFRSAMIIMFNPIIRMCMVRKIILYPKKFLSKSGTGPNWAG